MQGLPKFRATVALNQEKESFETLSPQVLSSALRRWYR